jgi:glutaredoxin-like protein NrdH
MDTQKPVKLYTLSTCSHCKAAKELMKELAVRYEYTDVDLLQGEERQQTINEIRKINQRLSFPTIVIGDTVIVGNNPDEIRKALGLS